VTRFAWLQSRAQTLIAAALLAALAIAAAITGVQISHLYHHLVAHCQTSCDLAVTEFLSHDAFMNQALNILSRAVPALLGIFWGAPLLAREFETGTYRLTWTQGVTRSRWLLTKLAVGALTTVTLAGALTLTITWWYRAWDNVGTPSPYSGFDQRDIAPIAYALFAFASGALIGALIRRTVPAMAATLGVFVFARVAVQAWIRPHLLSPVHETFSLQNAGPSTPVHLGIGSVNGGAVRIFAQGEGPPSAWTLSSHLVTSSGQPVSSGQIAAFIQRNCPDAVVPQPPPTGGGISRAPASDPGRACLAQVAKTYHLLVNYQPANRYWTFQWLETGIFTALALAAVAGCYWWVTHRAS
jgi:hypothetical protein